MSTTTAIVPTYNRAGLLGETIDALLAQTRPVDEILVIDDGSPDDTQAVIAGYGDKVRSLAKANSGKPDTVNVGIEAARGDYLWIVDDDDLPVPDANAVMARLLDDHPDAGFSYGRYERFVIEPDGAKTVMHTGYWRHCTPEDFLAETLEEFFVHAGGMLVRKSAQLDVGLYRKDLLRAEDYDVLVRLAVGYRPAPPTDAVMFEQRVHEGDRGPAQETFAASDRDKMFIRYDQVLFAELRESLPLSAYLPDTAEVAALPEAVRARAGLLARGKVMARRKMWDQAFEDWRAGAELDAGPLAPIETHQLRRALLSKWGCDDVVEDPEIARSLRSLHDMSPRGAAVAKGIARSLPWLIRANTGDRRRGLARVLATALPASAAAETVARWALRR